MFSERWNLGENFSVKLDNKDSVFTEIKTGFDQIKSADSKVAL